VCAGLIAVVPAVLRQPSRESQAGASSVPGDSVQVEHALVSDEIIEAEPAAPRGTVVTPAPPAATRLRRAPAGTFADKARRAILGDGRHRPEPFPRVKNNEH
jgi:hypothetical protein